MSCDFRRFGGICHPRSTNALGNNPE